MWKLALLFAVAACLVLVFSLVSSKGRAHRKYALSTAGFLALCAMLLGQLVSPTSGVVTLEDFRPIAVASPQGDDEYISSNSCRDCHPDQHASWYASWHRTMTQVATADSVIGNFDNVKATAYRRDFLLTTAPDGSHWATMHDPEQPVTAGSQLIERPIVMTTGSHHMQVYWYATGKDRRLGQLPLVWLKETASWVPIHSIFLRPTQTKLGSAEGRWNQTCIKCHTTQGRPRISPTGKPPVDTHVAEFGIACEACHGPGKDHSLTHNQQTKDQLAQQPEDQLARAPTTDPIVNPASLDHERSAEVCGQCHGVWIAGDPAEADEATTNGLTYRPGDLLATTRYVFSSDQPMTPHVSRHMERDPDFMGDRFWGDGMVRVSGREYNGLIRSPCFKRGTMSCLSCHDLHPDADRIGASWADDQLNSDRDSNDSCLQCHESLQTAEALTSHSHHAVESSGSRCVNCHMPHTTYGLLKAIRSHEISSPTVLETKAHGRPNACNQCHVDKTLQWTNQRLHDWYGVPLEPLNDAETSYSDRLLAALRGDAGERALAAWALGWQPALEASRNDWVPPVLAQLLNDPYDAVRFLANRSLKAQPGFESFEFDFMGSPEYRLQKAAEVMQQWQATGGRIENAALLISPGGNLVRAEFQRLLEARDDRVVVLAE